MVEPSFFEGKTSKDFLKYGGTVRGLIRYELTRQNVLKFIEGQTDLDAIDVGGGYGPDTFWLAAQESTRAVELVEPAIDQIREAERQLSMLPEDIAHKVHITHGTIKDIAEGKYDLALSHVVAQYLDDPISYWAGIIKHLKPGGYLSVLEKGSGAARRDLVNDKTKEGLLRLKQFDESGSYINRVNKEVKHTYTFQDLEEVFDKLGAKTRLTAGIRITEKLYTERADELSEEELENLLSQQRKLSKSEKQKHKASLLHIIVQKI